MSEIELHTDEGQMVLPHSGEVIDLTDEVACGVALDEIKRMQGFMAQATRVLSEAIAERAKVLGTKTIPLTGGRRAVVSGGTQRVYDAQEIERGLRLLGMPEHRIREIVKEEITYTVVANEAKRAAGANEEYAKVIEAATSEFEKPWSVGIKKR